MSAKVAGCPPDGHGENRSSTTSTQKLMYLLRTCQRALLLRPQVGQVMIRLTGFRGAMVAQGCRCAVRSAVALSHPVVYLQRWYDWVSDASEDGWMYVEICAPRPTARCPSRRVCSHIFRHCCLLLMWRSPKKHSLPQRTKACSEDRLRFGTDTDYADDPARAATGGLERRRDGGPAQNMEAAWTDCISCGIGKTNSWRARIAVE